MRQSEIIQTVKLLIGLETKGIEAYESALQSSRNVEFRQLLEQIVTQKKKDTDRLIHDLMLLIPNTRGEFGKMSGDRDSA